jgi:hypothetical protein
MALPCSSACIVATKKRFAGLSEPPGPSSAQLLFDVVLLVLELGQRALDREGAIALLELDEALPVLHDAVQELLALLVLLILLLHCDLRLAELGLLLQRWRLGLLLGLARGGLLAV